MVRTRRDATNDVWQTVTFRVTDASFMNSQNGGADFRLEATPLEIYLRCVSVTREDVQPTTPQPVR